MARILYAEDSQGMRMLVSEKLRRAGHEVFPSINADEALERFEEARPDLVITDLWMPKEGDGYRLIGGLSDKGYRGPVLVHATDGLDREKIRYDGRVEELDKDDLSEIVGVVEELVS